MKSYKMIIIFFLILFASIGFVCGADVSTTDNSFEINDANQTIDSNLDTESNEETYNNLNDEIKIESDTVDLKNDYKYNEEIDKINRIEIVNKENFVIEGNNHYIDGDNKAIGFYIINCNQLTIQNLYIKNCDQFGIYLYNTSIRLENLSFENNHGNIGGGIYSHQSTITCINNRFEENYASEGASIYLYKSILNIEDSTFKNLNPIYWSIIYGETSQIYVTNCTFENISSGYASAIYNNYITIVKRSRFYNLYANLTAGAIGIKGGNQFNTISQTIIEDCEFMNVSSKRNGGAIYLDINGAGGFGGNSIINNTIFNNCSSQFGGAILQLGGVINVIYSNFINNNAIYNGGALYTSNTSTTYVKASRFTDNRAGYGAAVYVDYSLGQFEQNIFKDNTAVAGGGIYSYDTVLMVVTSNFTNNKEAIHSVFTNNGSYERNNNFGNDTQIWDDVNYKTNVYYQGKEIILNRIPVIGNATDGYFNLKDQGLVTPVKNQGKLGACWAFGINGAFESAFLIATNISLNIPENDVFALALVYSIYGDNVKYEPGNYRNGAGYYLSWLGVVPEDDELDELGKITHIKFKEDAYHMLDVIMVSVNDIMGIKESLTKYGAMELFMYGSALNDNNYYNTNTNSIYYNGNHSGDHYVTIVGWDDNYSKDNFIITPPGDGAWICKNSWGTEWGDEGYFYISYYDTSLNNSQLTGFIINNTELYNKVYQYDVGGFSGFIQGRMNYTNTYTSEGNDLIGGVGTYFENPNTDYTITIKVNGREVYVQNGKSSHAGFSTIILDEYIPINVNDIFSVTINSASVPIRADTRQYYIANSSTVQNEDITQRGWVAPIKVYTINKLEPEIHIEVANITTDKNEIINITVNGVKDKEIIVYVNDKLYEINNGTIELTNLDEGSYEVIVFYAGDEIYDSGSNSTSFWAIENKEYYVTINDIITSNNTINITALSNIRNDIIKGELYFILPDGTKINGNYNIDGSWWAVHSFDYGTCNITASYIGLDGVIVNNGTITVKKGLPIDLNNISIYVDEVANVIVNVPTEINGQIITITVNGISQNITVNEGEARGSFTGLAAGNYTILAEYAGDDTHFANSTTAELTVNKLNTVLIANPVTTTYNINKDLIITLKDNYDNVISGAKITVNINGGKTYTTDSKGQVKIPIQTLTPKTYTAKITFAEDPKYTQSSLNVQITVKKANAKITAKNVNFKANTKIKKYTITLKNNVNKGINKAKLSLKINGKTYTATTNSKGQATFKITKLTKKGSYTGLITYPANQYYNKLTKKIIAKVK